MPKSFLKKYDGDNEEELKKEKYRQATARWYLNNRQRIKEERMLKKYLNNIPLKKIDDETNGTMIIFSDLSSTTFGTFR